MGSLAERRFEMTLRNRVLFGVGEIERLPEVVGAVGGSRVFVVTDPGVQRSGVIDHVLEILQRAGVPAGVFADVEPNPGATTVERGAVALVDFGLEGTVVVPVGGGSAMDTAKALDLRAANPAGAIWDLPYDGADLAPGRPLIAVPTTAGTGAETNSYGVITDESAGRKGYIGHPSLLPAVTILDPRLTVGLPAAATAATGVDAMTHSLESLLSANPNPFAEAVALGVIRTVGTWLRRAVADGTDLEARSQMLMASHLAGVGQASGTGVGLVHALGHAIGTRGRVAHGTALAAVLPEVLRFYLGRRDRELALVGIALGVAIGSELEATAAAVAVGAIDQLLRDVGQRPTLRALGLADIADIDLIVSDALDDAAIRNSPRLPSGGRGARDPGVDRRLSPGRAGSRRPQPRSTSGFTWPTNRSSVSVSNGAGCSEMTVVKPSSTYGISFSASCSGVPFQNVSSSSTSESGVRLWAMAASQTRTASASESRIVNLTPSVNSMSAMSRPTASQWPRSTSILCAIIGTGPIAFHMSAYLATDRRVFFSPDPPIMIGRCGCTGRGAWTRSSNA